jgi:hypothetical protein
MMKILDRVTEYKYSRYRQLLLDYIRNPIYRNSLVKNKDKSMINEKVILSRIVFENYLYVHDLLI